MKETNINFYSLERLPTNPKGFQCTTVHTAYLDYDLKDIFYEETNSVLGIGKWPEDVKIFYSEIGELEPILFNGLTWVIRRDLIKTFEEELGKKMYEEIEFLPVEIVPAGQIVEGDKLKDGPILKEYYMPHVLNRINDEELSIKDCKELEKYDFIGIIDDSNIYFSERVKQIIERQDLKIFKIFNIDLCKWARLKETEEGRKEIEERNKGFEEFHKELGVLEEGMKKSQEEFAKKMKDMGIDLSNIKDIE